MKDILFAGESQQIGFEEAFQILGSNRATDEVTLNFFATQAVQEFHLLDRFHAFSDNS